MILVSNKKDTPAPITFTISPSTITATHTVGSSPCPQLLGTIKVKNTGSNSISVILPAVTDLTLSTPGFVLAAGEEKDVTVNFTCDHVPPLTKTITFYLAPTTSGAATRTSDVTVQLNAG